MIEFKNICIYQIRDTKTLIDGLSFTLNDGEKLAIIGEEGNGKSTLLKWIYDPALVEGYAEVNGQRRLGMSMLGYLPQELPSELGELSVYEYLLQSCALDGVEKRIISRTAKALSLPIELFYSDQRMDTLSGGERVKLQLGSLLMQYCDVLLLDEPTNDLDLATLKWLEGFIAQSRQSILYISHDEVLLENTAQGIIHLEQVRRKTIARATVEHLGYSDYMKQRQSKMDRQRQQSTFEHDEFIKKKERYLSIYNAVESAQNSVSRADPSTGRLLKKKMYAVKSLGRRLDKEKESLTQLPEAEWAILPKWEEGIELPSSKVVLDFELPLLSCGQRVLAKDIALKVVGNKKLAIIGNNGCGKSTLIKLIWDSLKDRRDIKPFYMPQSYNDVLCVGQRPQEFLVPNGDKAGVTKAKTYLGSMKYTTAEMERSLQSLSGGQRAKLFLLKMILDRANVLILDEPTRNFSPLSAPAVRTLLADFKGCIISISHDRKYLAQVPDTIYELTADGLIERRDFKQTGY